MVSCLLLVINASTPRALDSFGVLPRLACGGFQATDSRGTAVSDRLLHECDASAHNSVRRIHEGLVVETAAETASGL